MLSIAEELLLLALDDEKGTIPSSAQQPLTYGLPAAGLSELLLAGRLELGDKQKVRVVDSSSTGDEILDEMLGRIQQARRPKSLGDWVKDFGNGGIKKLRERLEDRLVDGGVLRMEEGRYLFFIPWHHYPTVDGAQEASARERLRSVLIEGETPDAHTAVLVSLVKACKLLDRLYPKEERKLAQERAKEIARGEFADKAVSKAVEEATAVIIATMAVVSAAAVSSSSSS